MWTENRNGIISFRPKRNSSHDLLTSNSKTKNMNHVPSFDYRPRLVVSSGCAEEDVDTVLSNVSTAIHEVDIYILLMSVEFQNNINIPAIQLHIRAFENRENTRCNWCRYCIGDNLRKYADSLLRFIAQT